MDTFRSSKPFDLDTDLEIRRSLITSIEQQFKLAKANRELQDEIVRLRARAKVIESGATILAERLKESEAELTKYKDREKMGVKIRLHRSPLPKVRTLGSY